MHLIGAFINLIFRLIYPIVDKYISASDIKFIALFNGITRG